MLERIDCQAQKKAVCGSKVTSFTKTLKVYLAAARKAHWIIFLVALFFFMVLTAGCSTNNATATTNDKNTSNTDIENQTNGTAHCETTLFDLLSRKSEEIRESEQSVVVGFSLLDMENLESDDVYPFLRINALNEVLSQVGVRMESSIEIRSRLGQEEYVDVDQTVRQSAASFLPAIDSTTVETCGTWIGMIVSVDIDAFKERLMQLYEQEYETIVDSTERTASKINRLLDLSSALNNDIITFESFPSYGRLARAVINEQIDRQLDKVVFRISPNGGIVGENSEITVIASSSTGDSESIAELPLELVIRMGGEVVGNMQLRSYGISGSVAARPFGSIGGSGPTVVELVLTREGSALEEVSITSAEFMLFPDTASVLAERAFVTGGVFTTGLDPKEVAGRDPDEYERIEVEIDDLYWSKTEITNAQYAEFIDAAGDVQPPEFWNVPGYGRDSPYHPVVGISYSDASKFASWIGGRLPTEEEWEYVASNGGRTVFPWGDVIEGNELNSSDDNAYDGLAPVGSYSDGTNRNRLFDLGGNAWEWTTPGLRNSGTAVRGGGYLDPAEQSIVTNRVRREPDGRYVDVGFRVVWDVQE